MSKDHYDDLVSQIDDTEKQIFQLSQKLGKLRQQQRNNHNKIPASRRIADYQFDTVEGKAFLSDLFGVQDTLFLIHNMGQGCRYCTLWGDGLNPYVPHLESTAAVAMVSGDSPEVQRRFSNARGWRFRMLSHAKGAYYKDQVITEEYENCPGIACYRKFDTGIYKISSAEFGPGDQFCALWHVLSLAGVTPEDWTPQYRYWSLPQKLEDGGNNIQD